MKISPIRIASACVASWSAEIEWIVFNFLSSVGVYVVYSRGGNVGFDARFEPGFVLSFGTGATLWIGVNLFVVVLLNFLFTARDEIE